MHLLLEDIGSVVGQRDAHSCIGTRTKLGGKKVGESGKKRGEPLKRLLIRSSQAACLSSIKPAVLLALTMEDEEKRERDLSVSINLASDDGFHPRRSAAYQSMHQVRGGSALSRCDSPLLY